ncbi:valine--tRNA ligase [bacterium]|nr:valine--tRNA ligase [bacterium]
MNKSLDKTYNPLTVESRWYAYWSEHGFFHPDAGAAEAPYTIMIPPPNVTGMLTMGHILNNTLQDLIIRWKRMDGRKALWLPGTDHAGIATQNKVEAALQDEGVSRHDLGREKLVEKVWEWKEKYGGIILQQLKMLGASCDWERERFTMDEGLSRAVREVFVRLYEKGLIYRGRRLINWCPRCHTALSDEEAPNDDVNGTFWHIIYPLEGGRGSITVSTTRPETMLGDTAVAVHPDDERYRDLVGRQVRLPLTGRLIPVIADEHADPEKGSGAVKITPAHDFNDFAVAERHGLPLISVIDANGVINEAGGAYAGLDRFAARKKIVQDLAELDLLKGEEPRQTPIPKCYRCDTVVEPHLSDQWFVKMAPLAKPAVAAVRAGRISFHPKHWEETYFHWMENIRDWCISRQIWWGHRVPVWTCENGHSFAYRADPESCRECGSGRLEQDPDVLDTWFSSWLWPFSTLGWPEETADLKAFFPTDSLVTGPDIIFFWVARMIMASLEFMGDIPFRDVYFNGMIRDLSGRKMSKSLGNSPDPLWLIQGADKETVREFAAENPSYKQGVPAYGADAVRITMVYLTPLGGDIFFDHTLVEMGQKFCNKLWNASRFVLMNIADMDGDASLERAAGALSIADRWILSRLQETIVTARREMDSFRFNEATRYIYGFVWGEFCDWYLELAKPRLYDSNDADQQLATKTVLLHVLEATLRLLHPILPFITEEIWQSLPRQASGEKAPSIMLQPYPVADPAAVDTEAERKMKRIMDAISAIRNIRGEMNIPAERKADLHIKGPSAPVEELLENRLYVERLGGIDRIVAGPDIAKPEASAAAVLGDCELYIPLGGLIDLEKERSRIEKEITRLRTQLAAQDKKLSNRSFVERAPADVVEKEQRKQDDFREKLVKLEENVTTLTNTR